MNNYIVGKYMGGKLVCLFLELLKNYYSLTPGEEAHQKHCAHLETFLFSLARYFKRNISRIKKNPFFASSIYRQSVCLLPPVPAYFPLSEPSSGERIGNRWLWTNRRVSGRDFASAASSGAAERLPFQK